MDATKPVRRIVVGAGLAALLAASVATGCGESDDDVPTAPAGSRAQPTGTVNTTVAPPPDDAG